MGNRASSFAEEQQSNKLVEQINCLKERLEELEQELKGTNDWKERFEKEQREQLEILQMGRLYGDYWIERLAEEQKEQKEAHRKVGAIRTGIEERKLLDRKVSKRTKGAKGKIGKGVKGRKRKSREGTTAKIE